MLIRRWIIIVAVSAIITHVVVVASIPQIIMFIYFEKSKSSGVEVNKIYHVPPINASFRKVVLPSPDLLYSYCIYNVSKGEVLVKAEIPENTYWSVSFYDSATNNFYNDKAVNKEARILITTDESRNANVTVVKVRRNSSCTTFEQLTLRT